MDNLFLKPLPVVKEKGEDEKPKKANIPNALFF
jgi:hypothetical protein